MTIMHDGGLHGGGLHAARHQFPNAPTPWIDLSTGINPVPYPVALDPRAYVRLPEPEDVACLEHIAARAYGADPATVVAAPGTQILISLLPRIIPTPRMAVLGPTYAEHAAAWAATGTAVTAITSLDARPPGGLALCNPNNPDGRRTPAAELAALAHDLQGPLVVDEAFADLEPPGLSLAAHPPANAVLLRSFGKTYGLAGLRLGFAIAPPATAAAIRSALGPWPVSGPATVVGAAALADTAWLHTARTRLVADAARLDALLTAAGLTIIGGTLLFRLAQAPGAASLFDRLARAGILTRPFPAHPTWLRFGIPAPQDWPRLTEVLAPAARSPTP